MRGFRSTGWRRGLAVLTAIAVFAAGCGAGLPQGQISTGADGLRVFSVISSIDGSPFVCTPMATSDAVEGTLRGARDEKEPVWLEDAAGRHLSVVWPAGFTLRFEPEAAIYSDVGGLVARSGEGVRLDQTGAGEAAGTFDDPYFASGWVFGGCYPAVR